MSKYNLLIDNVKCYRYNNQVIDSCTTFPYYKFINKTHFYFMTLRWKYHTVLRISLEDILKRICGPVRYSENGEWIRRVSVAVKNITKEVNVYITR